MSEYGKIRKQVLEFYHSGHIPKVENLEKRIVSLENDLSEKKRSSGRRTKRFVNLPMHSRQLKNISVRNKAKTSRKGKNDPNGTLPGRRECPSMLFNLTKQRKNTNR